MARRAAVDMVATGPPAAGDMAAEGMAADMAAEVALARRRPGRRLGEDKI